MSEPVNLFQVGGEHFPFGDALLNALRANLVGFETTWPALEMLARHIGETELGSNHDGTVIHDQELAFHHLALEQLEATLGELLAKTRRTMELSERRFWNALTNRHSMGTVVWGKTFTAEGKLIPKMPKDGTPEHAELMKWARENGYAQYIDPEYIGFQKMQRILDDRAENAKPRPPHVEVVPQVGIKVKR